VVELNGVRADHDCIDERTQSMDVREIFGTGDVARLAAPRRDLAVERLTDAERRIQREQARDFGTCGLERAETGFGIGDQANPGSLGIDLFEPSVFVETQMRRARDGFARARALGQYLEQCPGLA